MTTLLTIGWLSLITAVAPKLFKNEELKQGAKIILTSMYIGILIGMFIGKQIG
jgi:hypothetical protein